MGTAEMGTAEMGIGEPSRRTPDTEQDHPYAADWFRRQPPGNFTIQVNGYTDAAEAARVARELIAERQPGEVAIFRYRRDGKLWHTVVFGSFSERALAEPARIEARLGRWNSPGWVRDFRGIHRIMLEGS